MRKNKLKGRIEFNTIVILVALLVVFVIVLSFFLGTWNISLPTILNQSDIQAECSKWQAEDPPCGEGSLDKYSILKEKYGGDLDSARKFCNCPGE